LRFIGDRSIQEKDFGRIQRDRVLEMEKWAENIKNVQDDEHIRLAIIAANNHYAGFGPGTANIFRNMLGLSEAKWEDKGGEQQRESSILSSITWTKAKHTFRFPGIIRAA
jgi:hypothetical protein